MKKWNPSKLQISFWLLAVIAGLIQAWFSRYIIFSDGVSYLDIADHYARGDWHNALNAYWSPFYSWVLALAMLVFRPSPYWSEASLHFVNYAVYLVALAGLEFFLAELIRFQRNLSNGKGLSEEAIRAVGYSCFLLGGLLLIGIAYCSPDMIAMALGFFIGFLLLRIASGRAGMPVFIACGILLGICYLSRAAFLPLTVIYVLVAAVLLRMQGRSLVMPVIGVSLAGIVTAAPFVIALSIDKGHFTLGETGKPNYGWEVDGAARSIHWQGEPYDIGKPLHPTHRVLLHPATYTFGTPVPGTYPPWYEPSYWYEGIQPKFKLRPELKIAGSGLIMLVYLFVRSPAALPLFVLVLLMGIRPWLSRRGILAYWFLWVPALLYICIYLVVYLDQRYIAGSLVIIWIALMASVSVPDSMRSWANKLVKAFAILCVAVLLIFRLGTPARVAAHDLISGHESEWNLSWMLAQRFHEIGLHPGDRIAYIGKSMDWDWPRLDGVKIVAEVPVIWTRDPGLMRRVRANRKEINEFWHCSPEQQERVFEAFREAGAVMAVADYIPKGVNGAGWTRVLENRELHLPVEYPEDSIAPYTVYRWLTPDRDPELRGESVRDARIAIRPRWAQ